MQLKHHAITLLEERDAGTMQIVSFFMKPGCSADAAEHLICILSDTTTITFNNEMKADGFTEMRSTKGLLEFRTSGHGSLGEWAALDKEDAVKKIRMLSQFNHGDQESRMGSIEIRRKDSKA